MTKANSQLSALEAKIVIFENREARFAAQDRLIENSL
jgi:hypothetical protein